MKIQDSKGVEQLMLRTPTKKTFKEFIKLVVAEYPVIGEILEVQPINEGYESANFVLKTEVGEFVLKVFEKDRNLNNIKSLVKVLAQAPQIDVPVPELLTGEHGLLSTTSTSSQPVYFFISKKFVGDNFINIVPSIEDINKVAGYLAKLNTFTFPVVEEYDSWGNKNLVNEYQLNKLQLTNKHIELIEPIVERLSKIDLKSMPKAVIHGDMQLKHVLKNNNGDYCILDFGCMSYDARIIDLSTYLAWFCLSEKTWNLRQNIITNVVSTYTLVHKLSKYELEALPTLIQAAYASYYMKTTLLIDDGDLSDETRNWNESAYTLLMLSKELG